MVKPAPDETPHEADRLLTVSEVARTLSVSRTLIYWLIQRGELPTVRIGHALRFRYQDVQDYIRRTASLPRKRGQRKR